MVLVLYWPPAKRRAVYVNSTQAGSPRVAVYGIVSGKAARRQWLHQVRKAGDACESSRDKTAATVNHAISDIHASKITSGFMLW
jgi:hypothetical protein